MIILYTHYTRYIHINNIIHYTCIVYYYYIEAFEWSTMYRPFRESSLQHPLQIHSTAPRIIIILFTTYLYGLYYYRFVYVTDVLYGRVQKSKNTYMYYTARSVADGRLRDCTGIRHNIRFTAIVKGVACEVSS